MRIFKILVITWSLVVFFSFSGYGKDKDRVNLELIGRWGYRGVIQCIEIIKDNTNGNHTRYAYCGTNNGLLIINVTDTDNIQEVAFLDIGNVSDITLTTSSNHVIVSAGINGLYLFDVSTPTRPILAGNYNLGPLGYAQGIIVIDSYAYLAAGENGLVILDITDPTRPVYLGGMATGGTASDVVVSGDYAYVADGANGLVIINVNKPNNPVYLGSCMHDLAGYAWNVAVFDGCAYVTYGNNGLLVIDISNPTEPEVIGTYYDANIYARKVDLLDHNLLLGYSDRMNGSIGFKIFNLANPKAPVSTGEYRTQGQGLLDFTVSDGHAYMADEKHGLSVIDLSNPNLPAYAGGYKAPREGTSEDYIFEDYIFKMAQSISLGGNYAYLADLFNGLMIIDISDPNRPAYVNGYKTPGQAYSVAISSNYAYVADETEGLAIIDITDPNRPAYAGAYQDSTIARVVDVAISEDQNYAYLACHYDGLVIINVSDPIHPYRVSQFHTAGGAYAVAVTIKGGYAYIALQGSYSTITQGSRVLEIIDITDPYNPNPIWQNYFSNIAIEAYDIAIHGNHAYLAAYVNYYVQQEWTTGFGLVVINITDPNNPVYTGHHITEGIGAFGLTILDQGPTNYAFLANGSNGVVIFDLSDPDNPVYAGGYKTKGATCGVALDEKYAYVADGPNGLLCLRIVDTPSSHGNLIICSGGPASDINPLWNPSQALANLTYSIFMDKNYPHSSIYYLTSNLYQDIDGDGFPDSLVVDNFHPTWNEIQYSLTDWAYNRLNTGPLYLYLTGLGTLDAYQICPDQILKASGLHIPQLPSLTNSLKHYLDEFQTDPNRDLICLLEFASSGSFCDDLIDVNTNPYSRTIITCTDEGTSFLDPNGRLSFTGKFLELLEDSNQADLWEDTGISHEQRVRHLQGLFSQARDRFRSSGFPFNTQPPQMITAQGPHTLWGISLAVNPTNSTIPDPNKAVITDPNQFISLEITGQFLDGPLSLNPDQVHYQSTDETILRVTPEGKVFPNGNYTYNGRALILATIIDPNFTQAPDRIPGLPALGGVTGRITIKVDIPTWKERDNLPLAIIVAGEKQPRDYLWPEIHTISQYAYLTLLDKGYSHARIKYLSHLRDELHQDSDPDNDNNTDLDNDGDTENDIDGMPSLASLRQAVNWVSEKGTKNLFMFLIDHGAEAGGFYLNQHEILTPQLLDQWLDELPPGIEITIVIESCHSGLFVEELSAEDRTIITSTHEGDSYIYAHGLVSFSYYLFTYLQSGASVASAYDHALYSTLEIDRFLHRNREILNEPHQLPQLDNRIRAGTTSLGGTFILSQDQPVITSLIIEPDPNHIHVDQNITLQVKVSDLDGIEEVWAMVNATYSPPIFSGDPARPNVDLPRINLDPNGVVYKGTYSGFSYPIPYTLLFFARDTKGNVSLPLSCSIKVEGEMQSRAVLVSGQDPNSSLSGLLSHAEWVLEQKGFTHIDLLENPNSEELRCSLTNIPADTQQLFLYLVGPTEYDANQHIGFRLNPDEVLDPDTLDEWLAASNCPRQVVLLDAPDALDFYRPSPDRIFIASSSCGQPAYRGREGYCAFSHFFFTCIYGGASLYQAFLSSSGAIQYYSRQTPWLEDGQDGRMASNTYLGSPSIVKIGPRITVPQDRAVWGTTILWAEVEETDPNTRVWALVKAPDQETEELEKVTLTKVSEGRYEAGYFFSKSGIYEVSTYVQDHNGLLDYDQTRYFNMEQDSYEEDDTPAQAKPILINAPLDQSRVHNFHDPNDEDWLVFHAYAGRTYEIHINRYWCQSCDLSCWGDFNCNLLMSIHYLDGNLDGNIVLDADGEPIHYDYRLPNFGSDPPETCAPFTLPETGFYLLRLAYGCDQIPPNIPTSYEIVKITDGWSGLTGSVLGRVLHDRFHFGLRATVSITSNCNDTIKLATSDDNGAFSFLDLPAGNYQISAGTNCGFWDSDLTDVQVREKSLSNINLFLSPKPSDPNCIPPANYGLILGDKFYSLVRNSSPNVDFWVTLYPGMNLFSCPCEVPGNDSCSSGYDSECLLRDVDQMVRQYYQEKGLSFGGLSIHVRRLDDPNLGQWQGCLMDTNQSMHGSNFSLDPNEAYLVYIDLRDPSQNLNLHFPFSCIENNASSGVYHLKGGKNLIGFSHFPAGYDSIRLFEEQALKDTLESLFSYEPRRGAFYPLYRIFGKPAGQPAGRPLEFIEENGYIFYMREDCHAWEPK